jgi:hypothetical protein
MGQGGGAMRKRSFDWWRLGYVGILALGVMFLASAVKTLIDANFYPGPAIMATILGVALTAGSLKEMRSWLPERKHSSKSNNGNRMRVFLREAAWGAMAILAVGFFAGGMAAIGARGMKPAAFVVFFFLSATFAFAAWRTIHLLDRGKRGRPSEDERPQGD